ncbi:MAG TPA: hypothetical protein VFR22_12385 [Nocardioidaceae bacterium]|nr:hypothetical protein [Nocardioidaceae bacterium]
MSDLIFVALTVAFFALCVAYVRGCDRIVESGSPPTEEAAVAEPDRALAENPR